MQIRKILVLGFYRLLDNEEHQKFNFVIFLVKISTLENTVKY